MNLLGILLPVILLRVQAQTVTEVRVKLGQNVLLKCSGEITDTYWFMEVYEGLQASICRTFKGSDYICHLRSSKPKFTAWDDELKITDITADDCRVYYCGRKKNDDVQFIDTFRLVSDVPLTPHTPPHDMMFDVKLLVYGSFTLNVSLLLVGLVSLLICLRKKNMKEMKNVGHCQVTDSDSHVDVQIELYSFKPAPPLPLPGLNLDTCSTHL